MIHSSSWLLVAAVLLPACASNPDDPVMVTGGASSQAGTPSGGADGGSAVSGGQAGATSPAGSGNQGGEPVGAVGGSTAGANANGGTSGANGGASIGGSGGSPAGGAAALPDPGPEGDGDFTSGPTYTLADDLKNKGNGGGRTFNLTLQSSTSKIYTGMDSTLSTRKAFSRAVSLYVPAQFKAGTPAPFMVVQDGGGTTGSLIKAAIDNLSIEKTAARRLPAIAVVTVANGGGDGKGSERGLEYDTMSDRYARFIDTEVLPALEGMQQVQAAYPGFSFTKDPEGRGAAGCSSGAAAAVTMAWFRPDLFRRVIGYSATLVDQQDDDAPEEAMYPLGAWDYHSGLGLIANAPAMKPVRMMINANENDNGYNAPESGHHNWLMANERTAAAFKSKGYHYRYVLGKGLGHCAGQVEQATMAETMLWLWRGYPNGL